MKHIDTIWMEHTAHSMSTSNVAQDSIFQWRWWQQQQHHGKSNAKEWENKRRKNTRIVAGKYSLSGTSFFAAFREHWAMAVCTIVCLFAPQFFAVLSSALLLHGLVICGFIFKLWQNMSRIINIAMARKKRAGKIQNSREICDFMCLCVSA